MWRGWRSLVYIILCFVLSSFSVSNFNQSFLCSEGTNTAKKVAINENWNHNGTWCFPNQIVNEYGFIRHWNALLLWSDAWILLHDIAISTNGQSFLTKGIYVFLRCHHRYSETICLASKDVTTSVRWYNIQIVSFVSERINPQSINLNNIWRRLEFLSIRLRTKGKSEVRIAINRVIVLNEKFLFNAIW